MRLSLFLSTIALAGAACGPTWPTAYHASSDLAFARHHAPVRTIDILPIDFDVWPADDRAVHGPRIRDDASLNALRSTVVSLAGAGYRVHSAIDWGGQHLGRRATRDAMSADEVLATISSLAAYGAAAAHATELPRPYLPVRLGARTGADATLYVGGWSYLGDNGFDRDDAIDLLIRTDNVLEAITDPVQYALMGPTLRRAEKPLVEIDPGSEEVIARSTVGADSRPSAPRRGVYGDPAGPPTHLEMLMALDETCEEPADCAGTVSRWNPPVTGGKSRIYLEMTLVDNRTGRVLWHAQQRFPGDASRGGDVERAIQGLMSTLPPKTP